MKDIIMDRQRNIRQILLFKRQNRETNGDMESERSYPFELRRIVAVFVQYLKCNPPQWNLK